MSLSFNVGEIVNHEEVTTHPMDKDKWHPVTEAIIHMMMAIDIGRITNANADEVWYRIKLYSLSHDSAAAVFAEPYTRIYLTREDIDEHVGLSTNVSTLTRAKWLARVFNNPNSGNWLHDRSEKRSARTIVNEQCAKVLAAQKAEGEA